jgi:hypothetical protein
MSSSTSPDRAARPPRRTAAPLAVPAAGFAPWAFVAGLTAGALVAGSPADALACPVCFAAANERVLASYYASAAVLTAMPFVLASAVGGWLALRHRRRRHARPRRAEGSA